MEKKGLRVNAGKTKVMICGTGLDLLQSSGEYPCAVCRTGVGNNSIYCNGCKLWVHKKCSGLQRLTPNPDYRWARCVGNARPIDGRPQSEVQVGPDKLEVVASFCYLGDMLSAGGGCEMAVTTRVKTAWKKFRELLPVLTCRHLSYKTSGHVYSSCVRSAMLHASEIYLTKTNLQRLQRNDRAMIRQIYNIKPEDVARVRSSELLAKLQLEDLDLILRVRRLRWFGHVERLSGAIRTAYYIQIEGRRGQGGPSKHGRNWQRKTAVSGSSPRLTLKKGAPGDQVWDLLCVQLASYLERGPLMWMMPLHLHVNQKFDYEWWKIWKCSLSMSGLCSSCNSVVYGRRHAVSCGVCECWQHHLFGTEKAIFFPPMVKLFQANETLSEQYKHVKMDYTNVATFFVAMTLNGY